MKAIIAAFAASLALIAATAQAQEAKVMSKPNLTSQDIGAVAPALAKFGQERLLGDIWKRPGLTPR